MSFDDELARLRRALQANPEDAALRRQLALSEERLGPRPHCAVLACVHSNLEALEAVLSDIDRRGIPEVLCLGEVVGYGPDPVACIDRVRERADVGLLGLHDQALFDEGTANRLSQWAREVIAWSREVVARQDQRDRGDRVGYLRERPLALDRDGMYFANGSPRDPVWEYVQQADIWNGAHDKLGEIFAVSEKLIFCAKTHLPGVITEDLKFLTDGDLSHALLYTRHPTKLIVNVGSVGQPRDRDPRACYVELRGPELFWHRVEYDIERVVAKIEANDRLNDKLGERLRRGL